MIFIVLHSSCLDNQQVRIVLPVACVLLIRCLSLVKVKTVVGSGEANVRRIYRIASLLTCLLIIIIFDICKLFTELVSSVELEERGDFAAMSTAILAAIAVILCILFRILNVNSQPQIPNIWCKDEGFLEMILKISPMVREA